MPTDTRPADDSAHGAAARTRLRCADSEAIVATHGAQLLSWQCRGRERLYLSPRAEFAPGRAIRGGVPVIFPQFADRGPGQRHGFARLRDWDWVRADGAGGEAPARARFVLREDADSLRDWPLRFRAELTVALSEGRLSIALQVANTGAQAFAFTAALHTYLRVDELADTRLLGLGHRRYLDSTRGGTTAIQPDGPLRFVGEVDRVYPDVESALQIVDGAGAVDITQTGFRDVVVWNPGAELAAGLRDLGAGEQRHFVCVEAACVAEPVQLMPGALWQGLQTLTVATPQSPPTAPASGGPLG